MSYRRASWSRREFVGGLTLAGTARLLGVHAGPAVAAELPPETTTIRLVQTLSVCQAPQYVAEDHLKAEGFVDVQYTKIGGGASNHSYQATPTSASRWSRPSSPGWMQGTPW